MTPEGTPPGWAEGLLRVTLPRHDFESVSGDLLEEYRETLRPALGPRGADQWYVRQVLGFVWRNARFWALALAAGFIARTAIDWLIPTTDFSARSEVSTLLSVGILLIAGCWAAWRSGSFAAGPFFAIAIAVIAAPIQMAGTATLLAIWHDPATRAAIRGSGGLEEAFTLPLFVVLPAAILGTVGGIAGAAAKRLRI